MVKAKQKNLRVFEIECTDIEEFEAYLTKNGVLLSGFMLLLKGDTDGSFAKMCIQKNICCATAYECEGVQNGQIPSVLPKKVQNETAKIDEDVKQEVPSAEKKELKAKIQLPLNREDSEHKDGKKTILITKPLRSGEVVETDSDITITARVNSGAKIKTNGNATILETVDGIVEVWGEYLILKSIGKGSVSFCGEEIKKEALDGKPKIITIDGKLSIKDL